MPEKMKNRRENWEHSLNYTIPQFSRNSDFSFLRQEPLYLFISAEIGKTQRASGQFSNEFYLNVYSPNFIFTLPLKLRSITQIHILT